MLGVPIGQPEFVRDGEDKGTGHSVSAHSVGPGHSGSLLVAPHVWFNEGQFLVEVSPARPDGGVC